MFTLQKASILGLTVLGLGFLPTISSADDVRVTTKPAVLQVSGDQVGAATVQTVQWRRGGGGGVRWGGGGAYWGRGYGGYYSGRPYYGGGYYRGYYPRYYAPRYYYPRYSYGYNPYGYYYYY